MNEGITPIVRVHITTWEDPDAPCECLDVGLAEDVRDQVQEALDACRERAVQMLWEQSAWIIRGRPITEFSCSHDIDPRNEDEYYVT